MCNVVAFAPASFGHTAFWSVALPPSPRERGAVTHKLPPLCARPNSTYAHTGMAVQYISTYSIQVRAPDLAAINELIAAPVFVKRAPEGDARVYDPVYSLDELNAHLARAEDAGRSVSDVSNEWALMGVVQSVDPPPHLADTPVVVTLSLRGDVTVKNVWSDTELTVGDCLYFIVNREKEGAAVQVVPWSGQAPPGEADLGHGGISLEFGTVTAPTTVRLSVVSDDELELTGALTLDMAAAEFSILERLAPGWSASRLRRAAHANNAQANAVL